MKKTYFKKSLSVIMAVLMIMSCWVFVAPEHAHAVGTYTANLATETVNKNAISGLTIDTAVTTVLGSFVGDTSYGDMDGYYKNVIYSPAVNNNIDEGNAAGYHHYNTDGSKYIGAEVDIHHANTVLLVDSNNKNPQTGMYLFVKRIKEGYWKNDKAATTSVYVNDANFGFIDYWKGYGTTLDFTWAIHQESYLNYLSTISNSKMFCTASDNRGYANVIRYNGTMDNSKYYETVYPSFSVVGWQEDKQSNTEATWTVKSNTPIHVINYVPLETALKSAASRLAEIQSNPTKYTTASVAKFVELAKALMAAKPGNYINTSTTNSTTAVQNWASAAKAAVDAYNAWSGLEARTYEIGYENMFSLSDWLNSSSSVFPGTKSVDVNNGTITLTNTNAGTGSDEQVTASSGPDNRNQGYYAMPIEGGKSYTFEYTTNSDADTQGFVFFYNGNTGASQGTYGAYHMEFTSAGTCSKSFTAPADATYAEIRFDMNKKGETTTFSNIAFYETDRASEVSLTKWANRQYRKVFSYGASTTTDYVPLRPGYKFKSWVVKTNAGEFEFATTTAVAVESRTLYSTWYDYPLDVNYENLFSLSEWANVADSKMNNGEWSVDINTGELTFKQTGSSQDNNVNSWDYDIPVTAGKTYTFEFDCTVEGSSGVQVHLFLNASTNVKDSWIGFPNTGSTQNVTTLTSAPYFNSTKTGNKITFVVPDNATNLNVRFGTCYEKGVTNTISNIRLYETSRSDLLGKLSDLKVRDIISDSLTLNKPTRVGYSFQGWFTEPDGKGTKITDDTAKTLTASTSVYSKWTANTYSITYNANGGTGNDETVSSIHCDSDHTLKGANIFSRTGYTFKEWNTKADGTGVAYAAGGNINICTDTDITLYAQWTINQYTVTFKFADGKTEAAKYDYGTKASDITVPDNTANKSNNALQHYVYSWPEVKDLGAADVTYEEKGTLENHKIKYKDPTAAQHTEYCIECNYTSDKDHSGGSATCTEQATCQYCNTKYGAALGHDFTSGTFKKVTDGENGTHQQKCKNCDTYDTETKHTWNDGVIKPDSTCTSTGTKTYTCKANGCGATYTEEVGKKSHTLTKIDAKDAKCEEAGNKEYWTCSECGKYFSDANGETEIKLADTVIAKLGHSYTGTVKSDGSGENATHSYLCKNGCGTYGGATAHEWSAGVVEPAATCTTDGTETFTCTVEGCKATYTKTVPATGHSFTKENATNDYLATKATCTDAATYYKSCAKCDLTSKGTADEATFKSGNALGHSFAQTNGVKSNDDGTHSFKCVRCETYGTDTTVGGSEKCSGGTANCVDKAVCTVCNAAYGEVDSTKHKTVVTVTGYAATCESDGKTDGKHCDACNVDTVVQNTIPATGHKFDGDCVEVTDSTHAYRCTNTNCDKTGVGTTADSTEACYGEGMTTVAQIANDETYHKVTCKCGNEKTEAHTWGDWEKETESSTEKNGTMSNTCDVCGYVKTTKCTYVEVEDSYQAPTCTDKGHRTWKCNDCGNGYTEIIAATKHSFGDTIVAKDANCTEIGNTAYKYCSKCNKYFAGNAETTATDGKDDTSSFTIPANGHTFDKQDTDKKYLASAQSCDAKAKYYVSCSVCGASSKDTTDEKTFETGDVLGHDFSVKVEGTRTDATCTADGSVTMKCSRCEKTENKTITKLGHEMTKTEAEEAKCAEDGNNEYYTCSRCSGVFKDEKGETATSVEDEKIDALGHDFQNYVSDGNATCTEDGTKTAKCERCDETDTITDVDSKLGHKYTNYVSNNNATCTKDGTETAYCDYGCGQSHKRTVESSALGHDYDKTKSETNLTRPVYDEETGTWSKGYYTHVCSHDASHTTKEYVDRADYTDYDKAISDLEKLLDQDLSDEAKENIEKALEEAKKLPDNLIVSEQDDVNKAVEEINKAIKDNTGNLKEYTVTFVDGDGKTIKTEPVISGNGATAPITATKSSDATYHYTFSGWDESFTNVTSDLTVKATFTSAKHNFTTHTDKDDNVHTDKCDCGYTVDVSHGYNDGVITTPAKCEEKGVKTYTCSICQGTKTEKIDALGHKLSKTDAKAATCKDTGNQAYWTCSVCGDVFSDENGTTKTTVADMTTDKNPANHVGGTKVEKEDVVPGTCKTAETWNDVTYCLGCGVKTSTEPKTGETNPANHTGGTKVEKEDTVPGTCKKAETWNEVTYCLGCNVKLKTEPKTGEINKDNHEDTTEVRGYKAADCGNNGYTGDTYYKCCDALVSKGEVIPATGKHKYGFTSHSEPTCTGSGLHVETCTVCGDVKKTTIDPAGHDCSKTSVAATCKVQAHDHYQCKNCDYNYDDGFNGPLAPHSWFELDPGKEPTCTETGLTAHEECLVCGDEKKATTIPMLGHSDKDGDGVCDNCDGTMLNGSHACGCICHKDSFIMRIIYAIARFFWKIFKINKTCSCGRVHY